MPSMKVLPGFTKEQLKEHGVYAIVRRATGRMYIGETSSIFGGRFAEHVALLSRNAHHCKALQEDWNKYGPGAFDFRILDAAPATHKSSWCYIYWREYLERKRILEAPLLYNTRVLLLPSEPPYSNPYTSYTPDSE